MLISINKLTFCYRQHLMHFNCCIAAGEFVAIIGPSGAGKSTFLNLIAGFATPQSGSLYLAGVDHTHSPARERPISMLFQTHNLFPHLTVEQNIALGLHPGLRLTKSQWQTVQAMANNMLLSDCLAHLPNQLSGGQQQRAALARCLIRKQPILLLDEPFSALDPALRAEMMQLLIQTCKANRLTTLLVSHQVDEVSRVAERVLVIVDGTIDYNGPIIRSQVDSRYN